MSNAGPLTTTFTAPSSCAAATGLYQIWEDDTSYYYEQGPLASRTNCFPSGYNASPSQYYSPGVCPRGYTAACSSTGVHVVSGAKTTATTTETAYTCCPTAADYTCAGSAAISSQAYLGCTTTFGQAVAVAGATAISSGSTYAASAATEAAGQGIGANSIAVRFKSGDFIDSTSGGQTSMTTTAVLTLATSKAPEPSEISSSAASSSNAGLSTAGIAGIGAGSAAGALMIASIFGLFWLRQRRRRDRGGGGESFSQLRTRGLPSSSSQTPKGARGPPPPRPPRPYPPPPPPPPSKHRNNKVYDYYNWPYSPSLAPSDEGTYVDDNNMEVKSKQLCATTTTIRNVKNMALVDGPFELASYSLDDGSKTIQKAKEKKHADKSLHELYGSPPTPLNHPSANHPSSSYVNSLRTPSPAISGGSGSPAVVASWGRGQPRSPPPAYGYGGGYYQQQQNQQEQNRSIYELETPQKAMRSPSQRHRRMPSQRFGTRWAPAELSSSNRGDGYL